MKEIVTDCDNSCSGNFRSFGSCFGFFLLLGCFFCSLVCRFLDQLIIKLVKNKNQKEHDYNGTDQANAGIDLFFQV